MIAPALFVLLRCFAAPARADGAPKPERVIALGHAADVEALAVSPNGTRLAAADQDSLRLWSLPDSRLLASAALPGQYLLNPQLSFSSDGSKLAFELNDVVTGFYDARTLAKATKPSIPAGLENPRLDASWNRFSSGSSIYELATGTLVRTIKGAGGSHSLALNGDGTMAAGTIATGPYYRRPDGLIGVPTATCVWDVATGRELWRSAEEGYGPGDFRFSPDGRTLVKLYQGTRAVFVDARTGAEQGEAPIASIYVWKPVYSRDSRLFAMSNQGTWLYSPPAAQLRPLKKMDGYATGDPQAAAFSADGQWVYAGLNEGNVARFRVSDGQPDGSVGPLGAILAQALSPDGRSLAVSFSDSGLALVDFASGKIRWNAPLKNASNLAFSPDGRLLAAGEQAGGVTVFDAATGKTVHALAAPGTDEVEFSPDGKRLLAGSGIRTSLYNMETGDRVKTLETAGSLSVFAPDGKHAVVALNNTLDLWNMMTGVTVRDFEGLENDAKSLAISPDGKLLAAGDGAGNVALWQLGSAKLERTIKASDGEIGLIRFTDGGRSLLAITGDGFSAIHPVLLDVATGERKPFPDIEKAGCAVFGPGDRVLVTCGYHESDVWRLATEPAKPARAAKTSASRSRRRR